MEFIKAVQEIVSNLNLTSDTEDIDKQILNAYEKYCDNNVDFLQYQEYRNILAVGIPLFHKIYTAIKECDSTGDTHYKKLADTIETIADELEKHSISCFSYSYFIYSIINYCIEVEHNQNLKSLNIEPIVWVDPDKYDYFNQTVYNNEKTFAFGRFKEDIKNFKIKQGRLLKYTGKSKYVIIPYFVQEIMPSAFEGNSLVSVYIPDSVIQIGDSAFRNCASLETVVLSKNIKYIYQKCFEGCYNLRRINLDNIITVADMAFKACISLTNVCCNNLTKVGNEGFAYCHQIKDYNFISQLQYIGENAFTHCFMSVVNLSKCEYLGTDAFAFCKKLVRVVIDKPIFNLGKHPFRRCVGVNYIKANTSNMYNIYQLFEDELDEFNKNYVNLECIKINTLREEEFANYNNVKHIEILEKSNIPNYSFLNCVNLEEVKFSHNTIDEIGQGAFENCCKLTNLDIIINQDTLKAKTFYKCSNLQSFNFLNNVVNFEQMCLSYTDLTNFSFARKFKKIGVLAFANCVFPSNLSLELENCKIYPGALHGVTQIDILKIDNIDNIYDKKLHLIFDKTLEEFNDISINNLIISENVTDGLLEGVNNVSAIQCEIKDGFVPMRAFKNCKAKSLKLIGEVRCIGEYAFANSQIDDLDIEYNSLEIKDYAFSHSINSLDIDLSKVVSFGKKSFEYTDISELKLNLNTRFIGESAFADCYNINQVTLPFVGQSEVCDGEYQYFGYVFNSEQTDKCYIQDLYDKDNINNFYIPSNISNVEILSQRLPVDGFEGCKGLHIASLPNVVNMTSSVFDGCSNLTTLNIGASLEEFSGLSINNCNNLNNIVIHSQCTCIKNVNGSILSLDGKTLYRLHSDSLLEDFLDTVESIDRNANCKVKDILNLSNMSSLGAYCIDASNVKQLNINNVKTISKEAFYNVNNLESVSIINSPATEILKTNQSNVELEFVELYNTQLDKIIDCYSNEATIKINELKIGATNITTELFKGVEDVKSVSIDDSIPVGAKGLFKNLTIENLSLDTLELPIKQLFEQDKRIELNNVSIAYGDINNSIFNACDINCLSLGNINTIQQYAFDNAYIVNLIIDKVDEIEENFVGGGIIDKIIINHQNDYYTIDNILYHNHKLLKCCNDSENLVIPTTVEYVYKFAFNKLNKLKSITINHSNIEFANGAISACPNLHKIKLGQIKNKTLCKIFDNSNNITDIDYYDTVVNRKFFSNLKGLQNFNSNPLTYIDDLAFTGDNLLLDLDLSQVTYIGDLAFANCSSFSNINISDKCNVIGYEAFKDCDIKHLSVPFVGHDIKNSEKFTYLQSPNCAVTEVNILGGEIVKGCFAHNTSIQQITLPSNINEIPAKAFEEMSALVTVANCENVSVVKESAFCNCKQLENVTFGNLQQIDNYAFLNCLSLQSISDNLSKVKSIGVQGFAHTKLTGYYNLDSIESIGAQAFENCKIEQVDLGKSIFKLENETFKDCKYLHTISLSNVKEVGNNCFDGTNLVSVDLPSVNYLGQGCFKGCESLTTATLNDDLTIIPQLAFYKCQRLNKINLPKNLQEIGELALADCGLHKQELELPTTVTKMGKKVFESNAKLTIILDKGQDDNWDKEWCAGGHRTGFVFIFKRNVKNKINIKYRQ